MRSYKFFAIATCLVFAYLPLAAQKAPWTLEQCIHYAIDNNIQIKQQAIVVEQNQNNLTQSKFNLLPNLNGDFNYSMGWGRTLDQSTYQYRDGDRTENSSVSLSSNLTLFSGFQKINTIKRNQINLKAAIQDVEKLKNDVSLNVAASFLQVLLAQEGEKISQQQLVSTKEQVDRTKKMVDAGKLTLSNLLDLQAQQAQEEAQLVSAQNSVVSTYLTLKQLLELSMDNSFAIGAPEIANIPTEYKDESLQKLYNDALVTMPEIKSSELKLESAKKNLSIARAGYYPSLNLQGSYNSRYSNSPIGYDTSTRSVIPPYSYFDQIKENRGFNLGLGLSIPIFNQLQVSTQVKNAKLNIINSELELQNTKNVLYKSIQQAQTDAMGYLKSYQASLKNVQAIEEAFKYTEQKFNVGSVTAIDYMVAKNNLFKAQSDCIQAKYQYVFKMKILDFYKGLPITL